MNPWAELGIEPTNDVAAIRRAYAARAKRTRPDEDPAGFARLRAAYEAALAIAARQTAAAPAAPELTVAGPAAARAEASGADIAVPEEARPQPTPLPPDVAAILNDVQAAFGRRDAAAAATLVADAIDRGILPIELEMELSDRILAATVQDRTLSGPQVKEIVRRFAWDGRSLGVADPRANYLKALQGRLAAANWMEALRTLAKSWRAYIGEARPVAARVVLGRGRVRSPLFWLLPLDVPLVRLVAEIRFHGGWLGSEFDGDRIASIERLLSWKYRRPVETVARIAAVFAAFFVVAMIPAIFGPAAALPTLLLSIMVGRLALLSLGRTLRRAFRLAMLPLWFIGLLVVLAIIGALNPPPTEPNSEPVAATDSVEGSPGWIDATRDRAEAGELLAAYQLGMYLAKPERSVDEQEEAIKWLKAAEPTYAPASTMLGFMYQFGHGVPTDLAEARRHYKLAADTGDPQAGINLAVLMQKGAGGTKDPNGAFKLFLAAAQHGSSATAMADVGLCYRDGVGVAASRPKATAWLKAAAEAGQPMAMRWLGKLYLGGDGAPADYAEAYRWLSLAVKKQAADQPAEALHKDLALASAHLSDRTRTAIDGALAAWTPVDPVPPPT